MADAAYYVGACQQQCNTRLTHDYGTNSALGYSGTNAGGRLVTHPLGVRQHRTGLAPNSLNNDDTPPPQNGLCPGSTTESCLVIKNNLIGNNNNANVPTSGLTPAVGAGVETSGGAFDTVRNNVIVGRAWGVVTHDYPDPETRRLALPGRRAAHQDTVPIPCPRQPRDRNHFLRNGGFGNPTNGDLATVGLLFNLRDAAELFYGNIAVSGKLTSEPKNIESPRVDGPPCSKPGTSIDSAMVTELICATGDTALGPCPPQYHYRQQTKITLAPLPPLPTMPDPCPGVPPTRVLSKPT